MKHADNAATTVEEIRAQAAERMLERMRMGLDNAVEALETVGYAVEQDRAGNYHVSPPRRVVATKPGPSAAPQVVPEGFLAEYPPMLTPANVAEILGLSIGRVRTMCVNGKLPATKVGNNRWLVPKHLLMEMIKGKPTDEG